MSGRSTLPLLRVALLPVLALVASATFAAGCSGCDKSGDHAADAAPASSIAPASSTAVVADAGDGGEESLRRPLAMRRGVSGQLFSAARGLGLSPETQKKVDDADKLAAGPADTGAREATKELHTELVGQVKAGKIEMAKLEPKYAAVDKAVAMDRDKDAAALEGLHAALDPTQRKNLVATVRAQQAKRDEILAARRDAGAGMKGDGGKGDAWGPGKRSLARLTRGIELDAEQQKKVDALTAKDDAKDHEADQKKRTDALLDAFEKDTFDGKKLDPDAAKRSRASLEEEARLLEKLLPILKPEQREKLAARMERGAGPHGGRRPTFGHRPEDDDGPE